jgi:predicted DNA-binding transcriptional regulator AlpA
MSPPSIHADYLSVRECAEHWSCSQKSIRNWIKDGKLAVERLGRNLFIAWPEIWRHEKGTEPRPHSAARYRTPLLTKRDLATGTGTSVSTVKRWMREGLPVRYVGPAEGVRFNRYDAREWIKANRGPDFPNLTRDFPI